MSVAPVDTASSAVARGSGWLLAGMVATSLMQLASAAVLGRVLAPQDFGLVTAATLVVRVVYYFSQFGLGNAVVQKRELTAEDLRTSSALALWIGLLATGVGVMVAPLAASALGQPEATGVARVLSLSFVLVGLGTVPLALLRRRLKFRLVAGIEVFSYAIGYLMVAATAAVVFHAGVWSLVIGSLAQTVVQTASGLVLARHRITMVFWRREATPLVHFGGQVSLIGFLEFACLQVDSVAVARGGEPAELGQYNRASILAYPVVQVSLVVTRVLLPAFARITDRARLAGAYTDALVVMATASFTTAAVLVAGHGVLVLALLGTGWAAAAAVLPWLTAASAVQALNLLPGAFCEAQAVLRPKIWIQSAALAVFVASAVLAVRTGAPLFGYAACWLLAEVVRQVLYVVLVTRRLGVPLAGQAVGLAQAVLVAGATYGAVTGVSRVLSAVRLPAGPAAAAVLLTGVAVPLGVLACWPGSRLRSIVRDRELLSVLSGSGRIRRFGRRVLG